MSPWKFWMINNRLCDKDWADLLPSPLKWKLSLGPFICTKEVTLSLEWIPVVSHTPMHFSEAQRSVPESVSRESHGGTTSSTKKAKSVRPITWGKSRVLQISPKTHPTVYKPHRPYADERNHQKQNTKTLCSTYLILASKSIIIVKKCVNCILRLMTVGTVQQHCSLL